ncbi:Alpha/Beta hydrolase protein [Chaetomium sp. MPI-SDFR-AT-0129]|nr:Alpha/Beta hydrolase protein [Chaetomium sp. MPI-SDFR-AT-0129]
MRLSKLLTVSLALFSGFRSAVCGSNEDGLTIETKTGIYTGLVDPEFPNVRQFRGIPFAKPPIGKRRWLSPEPVEASSQRFNAHTFPSSCSQYLSKSLNLWNSNITNFYISLNGQDRTMGAMAQTSSEDCLYLAIWTPLNATLESNLPVALFMPGGSFITGGVDVPYQQPTPWIQRSQRHIFVSANYRINVAGFPWAAGLDVQNIGILDQRVALEWVHANIASFGGDRSRITVWGQSAGGVAVDMAAHAFYDNPLAAALILQSGTAAVKIVRSDDAHANFTFVARHLGCDFPSDPVAELDCMRLVPMSLIQDFMGGYCDNWLNSPVLPLFKVLPDERLVFSNYTDRAVRGLAPQIPVLVSTTANEQSSLTAYPVNHLDAGPDQARVDRETVAMFACMVSNTTAARAYNSQVSPVPTYRYQYAGNFSSVTPYGWMGAYHASDIPMVFGTYATLGEREKVTEFQREVAETMQDYLLAFLEDPWGRGEDGGLRKFGWLPWGGGGGRNMMRFGGRDGVVVRNVSAGEVDDACVLGTKYDSSP